jgi:hypothetical protein
VEGRVDVNADGQLAFSRRQLLITTAASAGLLLAGCGSGVSGSESRSTVAGSKLSEVGIVIPPHGLRVSTVPDSTLARHILCFGDSTVEGIVGGFDFWIQLLREKFNYRGLGWRSIWKAEWASTGPWISSQWSTALVKPYAAGDRTVHVASAVGPRSGQYPIEVGSELFLVQDGNGTATLTVAGGQNSTLPADHPVGALVSNPCNIGPYHRGFSAAAGAECVFVWTRPTSGPEQHDLGANFQIAVCSGEGAGDTISTSVDGGATWQAADVAATGPPAIQLIAPIGANHSTSTIMVRAADSAGRPEAILGLFGLMAYPTNGGKKDGTQTVISNFAHSEDYLWNVNGTKAEDRITYLKGSNDSVALVTIGPYTNDVTWGSATDYFADLVNLAKHYSNAPVLIVGAFEQQGIETYSCSVTHGSTEITLLSPAGNLTQLKDGGTTYAPGRGVFVSGYPQGGGGLVYPTFCGKITSFTTCELLSVWSGSTGTASLSFAGRDLATQDAFRHKAQEAATQVGCAYLDLRACWGDFRTAFAAGYMYGADHESQEGHQDIAARIQHLVALA